jgi:hypothetical protein
MTSYPLCTRTRCVWNSSNLCQSAPIPSRPPTLQPPNPVCREQRQQLSSPTEHATPAQLFSTNRPLCTSQGHEPSANDTSLRALNHFTREVEPWRIARAAASARRRAVGPISPPKPPSKTQQHPQHYFGAACVCVALPPPQSSSSLALAAVGMIPGAVGKASERQAFRSQAPEHPRASVISGRGPCCPLLAACSSAQRAAAALNSPTGRVGPPERRLLHCSPSQHDMPLPSSVVSSSQVFDCNPTHADAGTRPPSLDPGKARMGGFRP